VQMRRLRAPISLGHSDHDVSLEEGRGRWSRFSDVVMLSVTVCTMLLLYSLHDARLMVWYERPFSRAHSLAESSETPSSPPLSPSPPPLPPPPPPPPAYANLPRAVSFLSRNFEANYMCEVGEAVRLELLAEKSAIHADRVMKDLAATPPCNRLQATFTLQPPVSGRGVLLESCVEPGRFVAAQKGDGGDVLLKLLPTCANASCTAEASRFDFDEAVSQTMISLIHLQSGEQLFARHQFGVVHMHPLEAHLTFVGDATWRVESGLSPCDDAARARAATLRRIAKEEAAALAGLP